MPYRIPNSPGLLLAILVLMCVDLAGCGSGTVGDDDGGPGDGCHGPDQKTLSVIGNPSRTLYPGDQEALRVVLVEKCTGPLAGETVSFEIVNNPGDSSLSGDSVVTDDSGVAAVTLTAGSKNSPFQVWVHHPDDPQGVAFSIQVVGGLRQLRAVGPTSLDAYTGGTLDIVVRLLEIGIDEPVGGVDIGVSIARPAPGDASITGSPDATDQSGLASAVFQAGTTATSYMVVAQGVSEEVGKVTFSVQVQPSPDCQTDADCPVGHCEGGKCVSDPCDPETCDSLGKECDRWEDGCGGLLNCGDCPQGEHCNDGKCEQEPCIPETCESLGKECGTWGDGCGNPLHCGGCEVGQVCDSQGQCQACNPSCENKCCGDDGCGGTCPDTCMAPQTCNTNTCRCEADPCANHCSNGALDCGETYFDCGGDCAPCEPIELGNLSADGGYPRIAVASPSRVMVVWAHDVSSGDHIRWRCFDGLGWSPIEPITSGSSWQEYPWIVADSQGRFHVVHNDGGADNRKVHYNRYDAPDCSGQWKARPEILPRKHFFCAAYPSVTVDENDKPYVIWSQSRAARQMPFPSCEAGNTCIAANEHCYTLANICIPDYEQHFSRRTGGAFEAGNWTAPIDLTVGIPGSRFAHHGAIFAESSTSLHAVWMQGDPSRNIWYSQWNGTSWSPQQFTGIGAHMADVQADSQTAYVFSDNARFATRSVSPWNGAPWSSWISVAGSTQFNFVKLRLAVNGRLHAVWIQSPRTVMYSMTDVSGDWKTPKAVSPAGVDAHEPSLDVDVDRNVHIVWTECTSPACSGEHGSIWYLKTHYDEIP